MDRGLYNSSISRVRPFFQALLTRDPCGLWITDLLRTAGQTALASQVHSPLLPHLIAPRKYRDRVLQSYGIAEIDLPACFEYELPPPMAFIRWLIENPSKLSWPRDKKTGKRQTYGEATQEMRDALLGFSGTDAQSGAIAAGLSELDKGKAAGSKRKWWAFEGFTAADRYLETDDFVVLIEGKRTEPLSGSTDWFPRRNQLVRNLEVTKELAGQKSFGVFVIVEVESDYPALDCILEASTPHLDQQARKELRTHYLGSLTWKQACDATSLPFSTLPNTTHDVVAALRRTAVAT